MSGGGGRAAVRVVGGKGWEKMAGVWLGHRQRLVWENDTDHRGKEPKEKDARR